MRRLLTTLLLLTLVTPAFGEEKAPAPTRNLEYARVGDLSLRLDLYMPAKSEAKPPLIVWIHGGGWRNGSKERVRNAWLVQEGYALASINYRLSDKGPFPAQIHDCKAAIRWLRANASKFGYDARHIGVAGSSAGGHLAALLGTGAGVEDLEGTVGSNLEQSSRVQAVLDLYGPADMAAMRVPARTRRRPHAVTLLLGGTPKEVPDVAKRASPVTHVTKDDAPFLILHGERDRLVPVQQSTSLHAKLRASGVPSELHVLPGAGHGGPAFDAADTRKRILAFFDRTLKGKAQPAVTPSTGPSVIATYAKRGAAQFGVLEHTLLNDEQRGKQLQLRVTYPKAAGAHPVIVWSHGAFGRKDNYGPNVEHWASHGFVVIQANHEDSMKLTGGRPDPSKFGRWQERPKDVTSILDALGTLSKRIEGYEGTFDAEHIGVGGHSFGAHTAQLVGGATTRTPAGTHVSHADERVDAVIVLSGQGRGEALDETSWFGLTKPALVVTGTKDDSGRTGKPYTWRIEPYTFAPDGDKTFVLIDGAYHGFGGITGGTRRGPSRGPDDASHVDAVKATTLLFWSAYLRGDDEAKALLRSKRIPKETQQAVAIEFK